ncbi:hypothetical protein [Syntrophotalea acetylenica]|uniref:Uncharacterized protein n=1 Tax=Syntrophotalea acetylenica TaxID=29542 RepID=A0A1L3GF99_SYNAC|nr:hypothetical protein [Syntrophotalea acetylenica]APG24509.1 hypothetical protein A7E75_05280 [Syntrophotalea acetylenica]APG45094.1 hypothetical protein A6070_13925 [Syntrophotalea acetylenica]
MDLSVPVVLESLAKAGAAVKALNTWLKKANGNSRALIGELKDNLIYLDLVAQDEVELSEVIEKISVAEYKRLSKEGFDFNALKRTKVKQYPSLASTDLASWPGKETQDLVESIYEKINDLKIRYPHVKNNSKYRWPTRVQNIRKRVWLLLKHVNS